MAKENILKGLGAGIVTIPSDPELIPSQASQDSIGFISTDGQIELCKGRLLVGAEETTTGYVTGEGWGYKADGTAVHFRKRNTKIQYYDTATLLWVDVVTGLTATAEYTFSPYQSLAGTFVFATGVDGIYKIHTANPGSYSSMYDSTKNYKGKSIISTSRMYLWDTPTDKTGLYGSYIDAQNSTVYTSVSEATAAATSGTLAFKAGDAKRTCFGVTITITASGEVFTDNYLGVLTGSLGGTGTINYTSGAWTLSTSSAGTAVYQWEMTNAKGVTDFTKSATRLAGEGFVVRQDEGGDAIQNVLLSFDGAIISLKSKSAYKFTSIGVGTRIDLDFDNVVFRKNLGVPYWRGAVSTNKGIIFMDTANVDKPQLTILQKNITGDNLEPAVLASQFDFSNYIWDACAMDTFGEFIVFSGRTSDSTINNKLFLYNVRRFTVDVLPYGAKTITNNAGLLYIGDVFTENIYNILSGFDDDGDTITNYWIGNDEKYGTESLKKVKRLRLKGLISPDQTLQVYVSYDNDAYELVGTILGNGDYVDISETYTIGSQGIGTSMIGGETDSIDGSFYLAELKLKTPKFRKRSLKLTATGIGYVSVNFIDDFNIRTFAQKLPSRYRSKQNVSVSGLLTNQ